MHLRIDRQKGISIFIFFIMLSLDFDSEQVMYTAGLSHKSCSNALSSVVEVIPTPNIFYLLYIK